MKKYQQGDVLIIEIEDEETFKELSKPAYESTHAKHNGNKGNVVLAFGEVTGHSHQFKPKDMTGGPKLNSYHRSSLDYSTEFDRKKYGPKGRPTIIEDEAFAIQVLADKGMTLYHEEHAPLTVPPGNYQVKIVQEFDHMTQRAARVYD